MRSLVLAVQRIGRGFLGTWCVVGPALLIFGRGRLSGGLLAFLSVAVLLVYAVVVAKWRRQGLAFVGRVGRDTLLMLLFIMVGSAISGVVSAFGGPALHRTAA